MDNQQLSTQHENMQRKKKIPDPLSRALIKEAETNSTLYQTPAEWYDALKKKGCPVLPRDPVVALQAILKIFRKNSSQWDYRGADDTWVFKRRLRELS